ILTHLSPPFFGRNNDLLLGEFLRKLRRTSAPPQRHRNPGKRIPLKYRVKIPISLHYTGFPRLKIPLCQLGFEKQLAPSHIHFGAIKSPVLERHPGLPSKNRLGATS